MIGVGGALAGGSGRTPLALAITEWLARRGADVAFVGHGYAGARTPPLQVEPGHGARDVGDEAVLAYRRLAPLGVPVWIGPREATLARAAACSSALVVDGLLQTLPVPLDLAVLALSAPAPWGSGKLLPRGDLRAPPERLVAAADHVIALSADPSVRVQHAPSAEIAPTILRVPGGLGDGSRWGLLLGIARPDRVVDALAAHGLCFPLVLRAADHRAAAWEAQAHRLALRHRLLGYVVTAKCDAALTGSALRRAVIGLDVGLPDGLVQSLARFAPTLHTRTQVVAPCLAETAPASVSP